MRKLLTALIVAIPLALAACGDDDKGPSKSEFIEKADTICAKSDKDTNAIFEEGFEDPQKPKPEEAQAAIKKTLPILKENLDELKDLERPKDDDEEIETIFASVETGVESLEKASASPDASLAALLSEPFAQADKLAKDYGMKDCGAD
jgi:hypothetical protein